MTAPTARRQSLVRRVSAIIVVTLVGFMGVYAGIATVIEGRRFEAAAEKDLLLLDAVITAARERLSDAYQLADPSFVREQLRSLAAEIPGVVVARSYDPQGRLVASLQPIGPTDPIRVVPGAAPQRGVTRAPLTAMIASTISRTRHCRPLPACRISPCAAAQCAAVSNNARTSSM